MKLSTYHAHSTFSDGKSTAEEMIVAAIKCGCPEIGISDHSPLPGLKWTIAEDRLTEYREHIKKLGGKYAKKIKVFLGIEQDTYSVTPTDGFDYVVGSAHAVMTEGGRRDVDGSASFVRETVEKYFGGDPYAYCEAYYAEVAKVYEKTKCDIIAHFDLVTKFIERDPLFSESHPRYIAARDAALDALLETPAVFEVNTGAISRGYRTTPYPRMDILGKIIKARKKIVINSDSHSKDSVTCEIESTAKRLEMQDAWVVTSLEEILDITRG